MIVLWVNDGRTDMPYIFGSLDRTAVKPYQKYNVDWLTVHHSITLVDLQLDAQNSCLFTYNTLIKLLYMFRALPRPSSGGLRRNCIYAASGIVTLCRWLSCAPVKKLVEEFNKCIICKYTKICSSSWRSNQGHNVELSSYLDLSSTGRLPRFETMQCLHLDARHTHHFGFVCRKNTLNSTKPVDLISPSGVPRIYDVLSCRHLVLELAANIHFRCLFSVSFLASFRTCFHCHSSWMTCSKQPQ